MGNRLRQVRTERRLSVTELKRRSGVSRQTIYSIENDGAYTPRGSVMADLARALDVGIGDLFVNEPVPAGPCPIAEPEPVEAAV